MIHNEIYRILTVEIYKLKKVKAVIVGPVILILVSAAIFLGINMAVESDFMGVPSAFYVASASLGWTINIIAVMIVIITAFQISNEFTMGTVKTSWSQPLSRSAWLNAKIIYVFVITSALILLAFSTIIILSSLKYEFADLMENKFLVHSSGNMWLKLILVSVLTLWSMLGLVTVAAAVSVFCNRPGTSIAFSLGLGISMTILGVFPFLRPFLLYTYLSLPFEQMTAMSKGLPLPLSWNELAWKSIVVTGVYMLISFFLAHLIVSRKEVRL